MIKLSDIINYLIQQHNFNSYLEIGVSTGVCFGAVNCKFKDVVDPVKQTSDVNYNMTSDAFFKVVDPNKKYDVILIDGLHTTEQVLKDYNHSLSHLSETGYILLDDTCPYDESWVIPEGNPGGWCGTIYKFMIDLAYNNCDINYNTVFVPHGHTIITRGKREPLYLQYSDDWSFFDRYRSVILNLISEEDFYMMYMKKQNETSSY